MWTPSALTASTRSGVAVPDANAFFIDHPQLAWNSLDCCEPQPSGTSRAFVAGERDPHTLATYRDCRIRATDEKIAACQPGNWRTGRLSKVCGMAHMRIDGVNNGIRQHPAT